MEFERLMEIVGDQPVFESSLLLPGDVDRANVQRGLSRWTKEGRLYQLRRGLYALAPPYQKVKAHPFLVANRMVQPSYVSLQSALAYLVSSRRSCRSRQASPHYDRIAGTRLWEATHSVT